MSNREQEFSDRLIAADEAAGSSGEFNHQQLMRELLEREKKYEEKLFRVLIFSWSSTFTCIVALCVSVAVIRSAGGAVVEVGRVIALMSGAIGAISLLVALTGTLKWFFGSRHSSLLAIERRLAALEVLLRNSNEKL